MVSLPPSELSFFTASGHFPKQISGMKTHVVTPFLFSTCHPYTPCAFIAYSLVGQTLDLSLTPFCAYYVEDYRVFVDISVMT